MKKSFLHLAAASFILISAQAMADQAQATSMASPVTQAKAAEPLLFVQTAQTASLTPDAKTPNAYTLTLNGVNPQVLWFMDRPGRTAGNMGMKKFVAAWKNTTDKDNFKIDHPNAALLSVSMEEDDSGKETAPVFTISQPNYDADHKTMTYHAVLVNGSDKPLEMDMKDVAVFIDSKTPGLLVN